MPYPRASVMTIGSPSRVDPRRYSSVELWVVVVPIAPTTTSLCVSCLVASIRDFAFDSGIATDLLSMLDCVPSIGFHSVVFIRSVVYLKPPSLKHPYAASVIRRIYSLVSWVYDAARVRIVCSLVFSPSTSPFCVIPLWNGLASGRPSRDLLRAFSLSSFVLSFILFIHFFAELHSFRCLHPCSHHRYLHPSTHSFFLFPSKLELRRLRQSIELKYTPGLASGALTFEQVSTWWSCALCRHLLAN
ncbi:hypothetical protein FA13DRAFT_344468 [Coprinellus micaceus]|uniref:Uncharacterized protein n=1 Tax=Coprinellus micaceus TaxID=71717 RepID=A0A4Y7SCX2_COPMI|nr:hypothetical protein FA13DRAFT_344468 [Coprinellus micaceus]